MLQISIANAVGDGLFEAVGKGQIAIRKAKTNQIPRSDD